MDILEDARCLQGLLALLKANLKCAPGVTPQRLNSPVSHCSGRHARPHPLPCTHGCTAGGRSLALVAIHSGMTLCPTSQIGFHWPEC